MFLKLKKKNKISGIILLNITLFFSACETEKLQPFGAGCDSEISYSTEIVPIINTNCISCHYSGNGAIGDFSTYQGLKTDANNGTLNTRVVVLKDMPQGGLMSDENRKKISCWIKQGALNN